MRILVTGASGSGATTVGQTLAKRFNFSFLDADDYFWQPSDPPFQFKRDRLPRLSMILADLTSATTGAVVSGSIVDWGIELEDSFSFIVFLTVPAPIRIERLRARELSRFGRADPKFLEWAAQYDQGYMEGRSLIKHERWLSARKCRVLRIDGDVALGDRIERILQALSDSHGVRPFPSDK